MFKKILVSLLAAIICATASGKVIGEPRPSFHAGVEGTFSFTHRKDMSHIGLYRQVGALGSYTLRFSEYFINPELSLYYQYYPDNLRLDGGGASDLHANTFGAGLGFYVGRTIGGPISIFTGPVGKCNIYQGSTDNWGFDGHRAALLWRFGVGADVWRLRIRASFDLHVTKQMCYDTLNAFSASVAYIF